MSKAYTLPTFDNVKVRKSKTVPDQSLSIKEIVRRFTRGIPVDVVQRRGVWMDQNDHDFEKLSRMDFGEKAAYADALGEQARAIETELKEAERVQRERQRRAQEQSQGAAPPAASTPQA